MPQHPVTLENFSIDATSVTNDDFARFVDATGYLTEAETFGFSAVFHLAVQAPPEDVMGPASGTPCGTSVLPSRLGLALLLMVACDPVAQGDAAWRDGRFEDAVTAWQKADSLPPIQQGRLARAQLRLGRLDAAAETLDRLPAADRTAEGHLASGLLLLHLGDLPAAAAAFDAGLALEHTPALLVNQCTALGQLGHTSARSLCQEAIEADPEDPRPFLGLAAASVGDLPDAAREAVGVAISRMGPRDGPLRRELAPWVSELWTHLGEPLSACSWGLEGEQVTLDVAQACLVAGRISVARPMLEELADGPEGLVPQRLLFQLELDRAEQSQAGPDRVQALAAADRWRQRLLPQLPESRDPSWLNDLGRMAWLEETPTEAEASWRRAVAQAPAEAAPRLNLAKALVRRGRNEEARDLLQAATAAGTTGSGLHAVQLALARLEVEAGEGRAARARLTGVHTACTSQGLPACASRAALELARLEAPAGHHDLALQHLEQAFAFGGEGLRDDVVRDPAFDSLADHLQFRQLTSPR